MEIPEIQIDNIVSPKGKRPNDRITTGEPTTNFQKAIKIASILVLGGFIIAIGYGALAWSDYTDLFRLEFLNIQGNAILTKQEILNIANVRKNSNLLRLKSENIQNRLEQFPYVYAAIVSKQYPNRLEILIKERIPICYLNSKNLILLDKDGIMLPIPKNKLKGNLPVITGFSKDSLSVRSGYRVADPELVKIVQLLNQTSYSAPELFSELSEIHRSPNGEYILYSVSGGTPILLGSRNIDKKFNILAHFQYVLRNLRHFGDYQYLDLRWDKQVIAKERNSRDRS